MKNPIQEIFISYAEAQSLKNNQVTITDFSDHSLLDSMDECATLFRLALTANNLAKIIHFKNNRDAVVMIIRGLPCEQDIPATPYYANESLMQTQQAVTATLGIYELLKLYPVTYEGENAGHLFRHVVPAKPAVHQKSSHGSYFTLGMHVDNCHLPLAPEPGDRNFSSSPEYLSLFCLRCDLRVYTKVAILDEAVKQLPSDSVHELLKPNFTLTMPESFSNRRERTLPILIRDQSGVYYSRFDREYTQPKTKAAQRAFEHLSEALLKPPALHNIMLRPGDFMIFKNQRVTHARESFTPRFDGTDRWLLRVFGIHDLKRTVAVNENQWFCLRA